MMVGTSVPLQIFFSNDKEDGSSSHKDQKPKELGKAKTILHTQRRIQKGTEF